MQSLVVIVFLVFHTGRLGSKIPSLFVGVETGTFSMAAFSQRSVRTWIRYANLSAKNLSDMKDWFAAAALDVSENKGGDIISGSTNGSAFAKSVSGSSYSVQDWMDLLDAVFSHIENGTFPTSRTYARLI